MVHPEPGDLLRIDGRASVQFAGDRALTFRVVSVCPRPTYTGWVWLTGYVLDRHGQAIDRREVFVQLAGLRRVDATVPARRPSVRPAARAAAVRRRSDLLAWDGGAPMGASAPLA